MSSTMTITATTPAAFATVCTPTTTTTMLPAAIPTTAVGYSKSSDKNEMSSTRFEAYKLDSLITNLPVLKTVYLDDKKMIQKIDVVVSRLSSLASNPGVAATLPESDIHLLVQDAMYPSFIQNDGDFSSLMSTIIAYLEKSSSSSTVLTDREFSSLVKAAIGICLVMIPCVLLEEDGFVVYSGQDFIISRQLGKLSLGPSFSASRTQGALLRELDFVFSKAMFMNGKWGEKFEELGLQELLIN